MPATSKAAFRVAYCSGEDPEYPARELNEHSPLTRGWQSARLCEFPQEIILRLERETNLRQVQLLSHQCKIATRVELFVGTAGLTPHTPVEYSTPRYKRLGFLSLDSNERSSFEARELKSVHVNGQGALFVKLLVHKCHVNKLNLYNQVGIVAVNLVGDSADDAHNSPTNPTKADDPVVPRPSEELLAVQKKKALSPLDDVTFDLHVDPKTAEWIRQLSDEKDKAVRLEDYERAKALKAAIDVLHKMGEQIAVLEQKKRMAVQTEDYDGAKALKDKIGALQSSVPQVLERVRGTAAAHSAHAGGGGGERGERGVGGAPVSAAAVAPAYASPPKVQPKPFESERIDPFGSAAGGFDEADETTNEGVLGGTRSNDDRPLPSAAADPTTASGEPIDGEAPADAPLPKPEKLAPAVMADAAPLLDVFDEHLVRCLFSRSWQLREHAVAEMGALAAELDLHAKPHALSALGTVLKVAAGDKNASVFQKAIDFAGVVLEAISRNGCKRAEVHQAIEAALPLFLPKVGDNQPRTREATTSLLLQFAAHPLIGAPILAHHITKKRKAALVPRVSLAQVQLLAAAVDAHELGPTGPFSAEGIMPFAVASLAHAAGDVRQAAMALVGAVHRRIGPKVVPFLKDVKPLIREQLNSEFGLGGSAPSAPQAAPAAAPAAAAAAPKKKAQAQKEKKTAAPVGEVVACHFCGKSDAKYADENELDLHFWQECAMLTACAMCEQVIEISTYNEHLLAECEHKDRFTRCARCNEAVMDEMVQRHEQMGACLPSRPPEQANRCPICHLDISAGPEGWTEHLVERGCTKNPRTKK